MGNRRQKSCFSGAGTKNLQVATLAILAAAALVGIAVSGFRHESFKRSRSSDSTDPLGILPQTVARPQVLGGNSGRTVSPYVAAYGDRKRPTYIRADASADNRNMPVSPAGRSSLQFIHIPMNGAEAIEDLSQRHGLNWLQPRERSWPLLDDPVMMGEGYPCGKRETPLSAQFAKPNADRSFCVLRDPYERMVEEFKRVASQRPKIFMTFDECYEALNSFVHDQLKWMLKTSTRPAQPYSLNCQFLPQAAYVHGWQADLKQVDEKQTWCSRRLSFEKLTTEANALFAETGHAFRLEDTPARPRPSACPVVNKRTLSPVSRSLIEQAFHDDFRLLGFSKMDHMEFIHIPRSGGSAVEEAAKRFYGWGSNNERVQGLKSIGRGSCTGQHTPPSHLPEPFTGVDTFCIVRDVYNKMASQFRLLVVDTNGGQSEYKCTKKDLNQFIYDFFAGKHKSFPYGSDCHFLPQSAFVYSWDSKNERVDTSKKWCKHVLQYEKLLTHVNSLFRGQGYQIRLRKQTFGSGGRGCNFKKHDFTYESQMLMNKTYEEDLRLLAALRSQKPTWPTVKEESSDPEADMPILWAAGEGPAAVAATRSPPARRVILSSEIDVRHGTLVLNDLVTAKEFELSFILKPRNAVGAGGMPSIMRVTATNSNSGSHGDRMPLITFVPRTTRLNVFMGHDGNHNSECTMKESLPIGQPSQVALRLQGDTLTVLVNGKEGCLIRGLVHKYEAMENVKVWIGDKFHDSPDTQIANIVYKADLSKEVEGGKELAFIGIPLNGGKSIEELSTPGTSGWGHRNQLLAGETRVFDQGYLCSLTNVPPTLVHWAYSNRQTFCVVRDPYERMVAEFQRSLEAQGRSPPEGDCEKMLNAFVFDSLLRVLGDSRNAARPYSSDCRFLPQAAFVHGWHLKAEQVDHGEASCSHMFNYDQLPGEVNHFLASQGFSQRLSEKPPGPTVCKMLGKANLNRTAVLLVDRAFRDDFRLLGFQRMNGRPPGVRTILAGGMEVQSKSVLVSDLRTAEDFLLAFEVKPASSPGGQAALFVLDGGAEGPRGLLSCSLLSDARLSCKVGQRSGDDVRCETSQGLPLHVLTRVEVQLSGEALSVSAGGGNKCTAQGVVEKHRAKSGARFKLGGESEAADAVIANIHYKVFLGEPEAAGWGAPRMPTMRTLIDSTPKQVEHGKILLSDLMTAEDFEVEFDIAAHPKPGIEGMLNGVVLFTSTGLHYGHMGDRMPALFFVSGTTRFVVYMGHPNSHNAECSDTGKGLTPGKTHHVMVRLLGLTFRLYIDGTEKCAIDGYSSKYAAMSGVKVYLADRFSDAANAKISNLVYRVAGMNEELDVWSSQMALAGPVADSGRQLVQPPKRPKQQSPILLTGPVQVQAGALVAENLMSFVDFEVSFDITPTGTTEGGMRSVMRFSTSGEHYGHEGDRMPAFLLIGDSTRLMVYMGRPGEHNAACETPNPGLPLNQQSHVVARLVGTDFTVLIDNEPGCTISGYHDKYPQMSGLKVWVGDTFDGPAPATIANLMYKSL